MQKKLKNIASVFDRLNQDLEYEVDQGVTHSQLKKMIVRDLLFLLNSTSHYYDERDKAYCDSVINFGIPPISGKNVSEINWKSVEENIKQAILTFEPRILPESLQVSFWDSDGIIKHNQIKLGIVGLIHSLPFPEKLILETSLDVETGNFQLI